MGSISKWAFPSSPLSSSSPPRSDQLLISRFFDLHPFGNSFSKASIDFIVHSSPKLVLYNISIVNQIPLFRKWNP
ncbi:hypothetical protein Bca101_064950 [Brassica carinata]